MKILVIPDGHAHPDFDNDRWDWAGKFIMDERPDIIVNIGDFFDFGSLCRHGRRIDFENKRFSADLAAGHDAMTRLLAPMNAHNAKQRAGKRVLYSPKMVYTLGNHDVRPDDVAKEDPRLQGIVGSHLLELEKYGWTVYQHKEEVLIEGVNFCHEFPSGNMGKAIGGKTQARSMVTTLHENAVCGHSHLWKMDEDTTPSKRKVTCIVTGCYSHPDQRESWNINTIKFWWFGLTVLGVRDGRIDDIQRVSMETLKRRYG